MAIAYRRRSITARVRAGSSHQLPQKFLRAVLAVLLLALCASAVPPQPALGYGGLSVYPGGAVDGAADWGDFDNDGDLDLIITGLNQDGQRTTRLYQSRNGGLFHIAAPFPNLEASSADWGDYDNDGYLDLLLTGMQAFSGGMIRGFAGIYHNQPSQANDHQRVFTLAAALTPIYQGWGAWADYNSDGRLDVLLTGYTDGGSPVTRLYQNTPGGFSDAQAGLVSLGDSGAAWGDYNNDNFPDLALIGRDAGASPRALVYPNTGGLGFAAPIELSGVWNGSATWIDADNDADLDLLITGNRGDSSGNIQPAVMLYQFAADAFTPVESSGLPAVWRSTTAAGDYNGDGYSDLLFTGVTRYERLTRVFLNQGGFAFADAQAGLPDGAGLSAAWGDFDRNSSLDTVLTGLLVGDAYTTQILLNPNPAAALPAAPALLAACWDGGQYVSFDWQAPGAGSGAEQGLTYNLAVTHQPGGQILLQPQSSPSGVRRVAQPGNAYGGASGLLRLPAPSTPAAEPETHPGSYQWAVQALNPALAGGAFSSSAAFNIGALVAADDAFTTPGNTPLSLDLLANDNPAFAPLNIHRFSQPAHGQLAVSGETLVYTPDPYFSGVDSFQYQAVGSGQYCTAAAVQITVSPLNTPLSLECVEGCAGFTPQPKSVLVELPEDAAAPDFPLVLRATDAAVDEPLSWQITGGPRSGTASLASGSLLSGAPNAVRYAPDADWFGEDSFTVTVSDPWGAQDAILVRVNVLPVNDPPRLDALPNRVFFTWSGEQRIALSGLAPGPANEAGQPLSVEIAADRPDLLPGLRLDLPQSGPPALVFTPEDAIGAAQVTISVDDGQPENHLTQRVLTISVVPGPALYLPLITSR